MDVRGYLDLWGETPIPTVEGGVGGSRGSQSKWGRYREQKNVLPMPGIEQQCPCLSVCMAVNKQLHWLVHCSHTHVGISNNTMTKCRPAWYISECLASNIHKPPAPPSPQYTELVSVPSLYLYLRQNTAVWWTCLVTCWRVAILRFAWNHMTMQTNFC
jgi:hypothetical protein